MTGDWPVVRRFDGEHLAQIRMPVGGIGTGCISLGGRGQLVDWEVQGQPAKGFTPAHSFFAVRASDGERAWTRVLERSLTDAECVGPHGSQASNHGLPRFRGGSFAAAYPLGSVGLSDPDIPVTAELRCFNPLVPGDADASGLPVLVYRVRLHNTSDRELDVAVCGNLTNFVGGAPDRPTPPGNVFTHVDVPGSTILLGSSSAPPGQHDPARGTLALAAIGETASSYRLNWEQLSWGDSLLGYWDDFTHDGVVCPPRVGATVPTASLVVSRRLPPGDDTDITFAIAWHFPDRLGWANEPGAAPAPTGNYYATQFADAGDVVRTVAGRLSDLEARTVSFVLSVIDSSLPVAFQDAALSNLAVLKSPTCFRIADGTFLGWEGCNDDHGSCHGSCTHVWNYQYALEALFGDLAWSMREVELVGSLDDRGLMSFRAGLPLETEGTSWRTAAADGQMGAIVRLHRTWRLTGDDQALKRLWPAARRAMEFAWIPFGWDADQDGVMEGCQHNTMDVEYYGPSGVNQSWYLAALASCVVMAEAVRDNDFAVRCRRLSSLGSRWTDDHLFNGEYYEQEIRPPGDETHIAEGLRIRFDDAVAMAGSDDLVDPDLQLGSGCGSDQLVGDSMALLGGLDTGLDRGNVRQAWASVFRHNHRDDFYDHFNHMRTYAQGDEKGLLVCTFPRGNRPERPFPYCHEVWTGFEYTAAIGLLLSGDAALAERVVTDVRDRYDGRRRNPFDEVECGHHYVRSMASWGLVEAWRATRGSDA